MLTDAWGQERREICSKNIAQIENTNSYHSITDNEIWGQFPASAESDLILRVNLNLNIHINLRLSLNLILKDCKSSQGSLPLRGRRLRFRLDLNLYLD